MDESVVGMKETITQLVKAEVASQLRDIVKAVLEEERNLQQEERIREWQRRAEIAMECTRTHIRASRDTEDTKRVLEQIAEEKHRRLLAQRELLNQQLVTEESSSQSFSHPSHSLWQRFRLLFWG